MKGSYKKSFLGVILAFILGTSCCWMTSLAVWLGGATVLSSLAIFVGKWNTIIVILSIVLLGLGIFQLWIGSKNKVEKL